MTTLEWLERAPADMSFTLTAAELRKLLKSSGEIEEGTPGQVAKLLGRSANYWRSAAPTIDGAYQDNGRWHLPLAACRAHLARKRAKQEGQRRGPYRKPKSKRAVVSARPVLGGRPEKSLRDADVIAGSIAPGLAFGRSANDR